jgi:hypothetical protein
LLTDALRYLPNLRNFLLKRIECFVALNKIQEASKEIKALREKISKAEGEKDKEKEES